MSAKPSPFCWYELMTSDPVAATAFYKAVIGWSTADAGMPGMAYTLLSVGEAQVGGLMKLDPATCPPGVPPCWTGYVWVDDVDAYCKRLATAGGKVQRPPEDIAGVGRFAVVADPHGAVFILFKDASGPQRPPVAAGTPGHIGWHELQAGNGAAAFDFYAALFGWTKGQAVEMGPMGIYQCFATGGEDVGGMMTKMPEVPGPFWLYYFNVDALDAAVARAVAGGGKLLMGPQEVPGGSWIAQCLDPQGALFAMVSAKR